MKQLTYILLLSTIFFVSCNDEELDNNESGIEEEEVPDEPIISATETCFYSDFTIEANSTVVINCLLDLEGQTIEVPEGVTFVFEGGNIFNGTLNFTSAGLIDGELLNSNLEIEGDVQLTNEEFTFIPSRWEIVEADSLENPIAPSLEIAYNNHLIIQGTLDLVYSLGANTFSIGRMNAFFDSMNGSTNAAAARSSVLIIPSHFNLEMSDNTYIRVQPVSGILSSILIRINRGTDITVTGGNLIGDRLDHGPEDGIAGVLFRVNGAKNLHIEGVNMEFSNHSGLTIHSSSFIERPDYFGSDNVTVINNTFDSNRGNNLSLTDGQNVLIEGNVSKRAGIELEGPYYTSTGIEPRIGIIVETQVMQYVENVIIRNNIVEDTQSLQGHSILAVGATNVEISGNTADQSVGWSTALGVRLLNNTAGRIFGGFLGFEGVDNIISGNTITNEDGAGIFLTDQNVEVYDNDLINCKTAIQLSSLINVNIHDNTITSNIEGSTGIVGQNYLNNVNVYNNDITLTSGKPLNLISINSEEEYEEYQFTFTENTISASDNGLMPGSSNITIDQNVFTGAGIGVSEGNNISVTNNTVLSTGDFAPFAINNSNNIIVTRNLFESTNNGPFSIGTTINNSTGIDFHNNTVKALGINFGMYVESNDLSIRNNTIQNESTFRGPLHFIGNNSEIIENTFINSNGQETYYEGNGNTILGNN